MGKVNLDIRVSLDGFMMASNCRPKVPIGDGGEHLHEWASGEDERDRELLEGAVEALGAVVAGRTTYEDSLPWWGTRRRSESLVRCSSSPTRRRPRVPKRGVYTSLTDSIKSALE